MSVKIRILLQDADVPMHHHTTIAQLAAILYMIGRGLQHHSNPAYTNMTSVI
jgi:hypothetical protein